MMISITGFRKVAFTPENATNEIRGTTVYYCFEDDHIQGLGTGKLFVPENRQNPFQISKTYTYGYNQYGKVDWSSVKECER